MQARLFFSREQMPVTIVITLSHSIFEYEAEIARLLLPWVCLNDAITCLGKDHFEGKSAIILVTVFVGPLPARLHLGDSGQPRGSLT